MLTDRVIEMERSVIGLALAFDNLAAEIVSAVERDMFHMDAHRIIHDAIRHLQVVSPGGVDEFTVGSVIRERNAWTETLTPTYLGKLVKDAVVPEHFWHHVRRVRQAYFTRKILALAVGIRDEGADDIKITELQRMAVARAAEGAEDYFRFTHDLHAFLDDLERVDPKGKAEDTGFVALDRIVGGIKRGDLFAVAARPNGGKTAVLAQIITRFVDRGLRGLYFSTEMPRNQFVSRIMPAKAEIEAWKFRRANFTDKERDTLHDACDGMHGKFDLVVCDDPRPDLATIRRALLKVRPDVFAFDYLQRARKPRAENHVRSVDEFMTELKGMCLEFKTIGLLGCQLNRAVDRNPGPPKLADLRDSGSIESESDQVLLLHPDQSQDQGAINRRIHADLAKNRHGQTGEVMLVLNRTFMRVDEDGGQDAGQTDDSANAGRGAPASPSEFTGFEGQ